MGKETTHLKPVLQKLCLTGGIFVSLGCIAGAAAQPASVPDFWAGDAGWVHVLNATFPPVQGSPSPVVQDPGHPFIGASWRIGDLANPNLKPWVKEVMKKDNDEIDREKSRSRHARPAFRAAFPICSCRATRS